MKKVGLYLNVDPTGGGTFQYAQTIVEALNSLDKEYFQIEIAYANPEWVKILQKYDFNKIHLTNAAVGKLISDLFMALFLPGKVCRFLSKFINPLVKELINRKCDIWIFPGQESISYQVPGKVISTIHDLMHKYEPGFPEVSSKFRYHIRENRYKNIVNNSNIVLVDSEIGKQHVVESYKSKHENIAVLPFIAPKYIKNNDERDDFDETYNLPEKFIFYPAQFWLHKNHYNLFKAIKIVKESIPKIFLVLTGGKNHFYKKIYLQAKELDLLENISFAGYVPDEDFRGFYKRARSLVMPSYFGPTNIPPLEAMATGCPLIISDVYGMKEQSGNAALYFNPNSPNEIAEQIKVLWSDDVIYQEMSKRAYARNKLNSQETFNMRFKEIIDVSLK